MAHNLNIKPNGTASFVSKKELPWHIYNKILGS